MPTAIAVGSMLASGASAAAGAGAIAATGIAGVSFGTIATGLGIAGQALSFFEGQSQADAAYDAQISASRAALDASRVQVAQQDVESQRARTQASIEEAERQRRLRRTLADQKARFAGGGADITTGTPTAIQDQTVGEINRESRFAELGLQDTLTSNNIQSLGIEAAGIGKSLSLISSAEAGLSSSKQKGLAQLGSIGSDVTAFASTFKKGS